MDDHETALRFLLAAGMAVFLWWRWPHVDWRRRILALVALGALLLLALGLL